MAKQRWSDLSPAQRRMIAILGAVQLSPAAAAWADLAKRPPAAVRGSRLRWALIIAINWVGPLSYFRWGRRPLTP